jgi:hypothetical protein
MPAEGPHRLDVLRSLKRALDLGDSAPATMHKGAYVVGRHYLEGEDAPAHDFAQAAIEAARAVLRARLAAGATPPRVTIKQVAVDDDPRVAPRALSQSKFIA